MWGGVEREAWVWGEKGRVVAAGSLLTLWPCCRPGIAGVDMLPSLSPFILASLMGGGGQENPYKSYNFFWC